MFSCGFCEIFKNLFFKEHFRTNASGFFLSFHCFLSPSELIETSFLYILNMFYEGFWTWWTNIMNLKDFLGKGFKAFLGNITVNLAVFCWLINIYMLYTYWIWEAVTRRCSVKKGLRPATSLKERLWHRCFPVNFAKFLRTPFLTEHLRWLLLEFLYSTVLQLSTSRQIKCKMKLDKAVALRYSVKKAFSNIC